MLTLRKKKETLTDEEKEVLTLRNRLMLARIAEQISREQNNGKSKEDYCRDLNRIYLEMLNTEPEYHRSLREEIISLEKTRISMYGERNLPLEKPWIAAIECIDLITILCGETVKTEKKSVLAKYFLQYIDNIFSNLAKAKMYTAHDLRSAKREIKKRLRKIAA